jgi:hypothetical protein
MRLLSTSFCIAALASFSLSAESPTASGDAVGSSWATKITGRQIVAAKHSAILLSSCMVFAPVL